ncbi:MAG: hypothetical protein JNM79_25440 [Burkholderiales bacterium]|nr:hypothetical protein [Burkholderiales bacterium]
MRRFVLAILATSAIALTPQANASGGHDHSPKHGGVVVEVRDIDLELVLKPDLARLHVRDHGKPVKLEGAGARLTLLAGAEKTEATLARAGDALEAKGNFKTGAGVKAVVVLTLPGKAPITARFTFK